MRSPASRDTPVEASPSGMDSFQEVTAFLKKGSQELLWISYVISLPHVVHKGEVGPTPVIIDVWKEERFPV